MKRVALLLVSLLYLTIGMAQTEVNRFVPGTTVDGVNYFMPQTAFRITVVAEKKVTMPGELNKYAFRYLRMQDVVQEGSTEWSIKSITMEPYGVPDRSKAYNVKLKPKTAAPLVSLTHDGILLAINTDAEETTLPPLPQGTPAETPLNPKQYMSQEILSAGSTAKMAELCAQEIYDIRESRNALIRGEADNTPKDGEQLRLMLDQLDTQSRALEQLFTGYTLTSTEVFSFNFLPSAETDKELLFRFSQYSGAVDADDLSGRPVYISIKNTGDLPAKVENAETDKKKAKIERGLYYNVPARETVSIFDLNETYLTAEYSMGQFGYTEILSNLLFDKKLTTKVSFYQENGGVRKLEQ